MDDSNIGAFSADSSAPILLQRETLDAFETGVLLDWRVGSLARPIRNQTNGCRVGQCSRRVRADLYRRLRAYENSNNNREIAAIAKDTVAETHAAEGLSLLRQ